MTRVFGILRKRYAKTPLDGEGSYRFGGRWSSPGTRLAYCAGHLSLAMLEYYVHIDPEDRPDDLVVVSADIPDRVSRRKLGRTRLPSNWRESPPPPGLAAIGDAFSANLKAAILLVPSALAPTEFNWLINPRHPDFPAIRLRTPEPLYYDKRLFM